MMQHVPRARGGLTVGLLVAGTRTRATKLLRLAAARVSNKEAAVVADEKVAQLLLGRLVHVLLVVRNDGLGNGLAHGVDLRRGTTTLDKDANVQARKALLTEDEDGLKGLQAQRLRLHQLQRRAIHADGAGAGLAGRIGSRCLFTTKALNHLHDDLMQWDG